MRIITLFIFSFITWCLLVWPCNAVTGALDMQIIVFGLAASAVVTWLFHEILITHPHKWYDVKRYFWLLVYLPVFAYYCIKANIDVVYRVLHPKMPIRPGIVKVKTSLKSDSALTALANSITLTPGTLTVDIVDDGYLYIHWINVESEDLERSSELIVKKFEGFLRRIFE